MNSIKIKPVDPLVTVRDPLTRKALAAKGEEKPRSPYWIRRLADRDVVEVSVRKSATVKQSKAKKPKSKTSKNKTEGGVL